MSESIILNTSIMFLNYLYYKQTSLNKLKSSVVNICAQWLNYNVARFLFARVALQNCLPSNTPDSQLFLVLT